MLEKELERKFKDAVKKEGGKAYKFTSPGNDGVPDRLVVLPGNRIGFVELKQTGKSPTELQKKQIGNLRALGCCAMVLDRAEDIPEVISRIKLHSGRRL